MTEKEKRERQIIENEHNSKLTSKKREDAINHLWEIGKYKNQQELGDLLGISRGRISEIIKAKETRDYLKEAIPKSISTSRSSSKKKKGVIKKDILPLAKSNSGDPLRSFE